MCHTGRHEPVITLTHVARTFLRGDRPFANADSLFKCACLHPTARYAPHLWARCLQAPGIRTSGITF